MSRLGVAIAVSLTLASFAHAEEMRVRTGEHGDFTRLVLAFDVLPDWDARQVGTGYEIDFDGAGALVTDLSRAFALIGRNRIDSIDVLADERRVLLGLACVCHAEVFDLNGTTLVLDVRNGPAPSSLRPLQRAQPIGAANATPQIRWTSPDLLRSPEAESRREILGGRGDMPIIRPRKPSQVAVALSTPGSRDAMDTESAPEFLSHRGAKIDRLPTVVQIPSVNSVAIDAVTKQLGRAAAQGLVDVGTASTITDPGARNPETGPRNFRAFTGVDRASGALDSVLETTISGMSCVPDYMVDVLAWGDPVDAKELGYLRAKIVKETGAADPDALRALARYYLVLGFGAEARFAAQQLSQGLEHSVLLALADIVDHGKSNAPLFGGQLACPGKIALWAALAGPFSRSDLPVSTDNILTTFSALPAHLRKHLGPVLSQRLRSAGESALARAALSAVTRVGPGSVGQDLTAARLELSGTRAANARAELERIAQGTSVEAAEALLELLQDARRRKVTPKPDWVEDADALIRVTEGTKIADDLSIASLRGHIPLGRFDDLRRALTEGRPGLTTVLRRDISADALAAAVSDSDDETFLRTELGLSDFAEPQTLDATKRFAFVRRFLGLGLPKLAKKYLPEDVDTVEERKLSIATQLALGQFAEALSLFDASSEGELLELQATTLAELRDFSTASQLLNSIGDAPAAELQALRSGDWSWIAAQGPEELSQTVLIATAPPPTVDEASRNTSLVIDAAARRAAYLELLSRTTSLDAR